MSFLERPDLVRRLNLFGPATGDARNIVPLDPDEMLATARAATGLEYVGDELYEETYRRQITAVDEEANLHVVGRLLCRGETIRLLETKLRLEDTWAQNPAILDEPITAPIFVLGPPRTGTSILLELLALDPGLRAPIAWEAHHPLPLGEPSADDTALRQELAQAEQELWADIQPEFQAVHELRSDLPCECIHFLALEFQSGYHSMNYDTPGFQAWTMEHPELFDRLYLTHQRFLQTLQHGGAPRPWVLKSPVHMPLLPQIFARYPDARIIHTHRDPLKVVTSAASTIATVRWLRSDAVDPLRSGQQTVMGNRFLLELVMAQRADGTVPADRFVDSHFSDLIADPVAALQKIYAAFGLPWPDGHGDVITAYLDHKPKGKFGAHRYSADSFGIEPDAVREAFANYMEHYGIVHEDG
ncbi:MAG: sulfotransferase [Acidimicrobiales bacterium]|nr:sulfotransferase [Acidimicrobiales bacterium]